MKLVVRPKIDHLPVPLLQAKSRADERHAGATEVHMAR